MTFYRYINNRFQEVAKDSAQKPFSVLRAGEASAIQFLLYAFGIFMGAAMVPKVFLWYPLTLFGVIKKPMPVLDLMNAEQAQKDFIRKQKLSRKVGMAN